jgi:cohesin complex subunit SA-1/2
MWKVRAVGKLVSSAGLIPPSTLQALQKRKEKFAQVITDILSSRTSAEEIRLVLAPVLIDLFVAFAGLVHIKPAKRPTRKSNTNSEQDGEEEDSSKSRAHLVLVSEIPKATQALLLQILSSAEKAYAKRTKRTLEDADETEEPGIDDEPEDSDDDDEPMEDVDDDAGKEAKLAADLVAEQRLCDFASGLVLGIWAAVLDGKQEGGKDMVRKRLRRNRAKLGPNFKACIEALDRGGPLAGGKAAAKKATAATKKKAAVSKAIIVESDEEEDEDQADGGQDDGNEEIREDSPEVAISEKAAEESVLGD